MTPYPYLDRLARSQRGLLTIRQLRTHGLTYRQIVLRARAGLIVPVRYGVYRWCGTTVDWQTMAAAAVLAAGGDAVLSHRSAGVVWGLLDHHGQQRLEITAGRAVRLDGVSAHRHRLHPGERTVRAGVAVTSVERTLMDLAETVPEGELGRLVDEALRRRLTTVGRVRAAARFDPGGRRRGRRVLAQVMAERAGGYEPGANDWEKEMDRLWDVWGLPPAARQHPVRIRGRRFRIDRAIVGLKVAVEWNGREYHGSRSGFERDAMRKALLIQAGWLVVEVTPHMAAAEVVRTVLAAVRARSGQLAAKEAL